jgi:hypothetical protein
LNRQEKKRLKKELLKISPKTIVMDSYFLKYGWGRIYLSLAHQQDRDAFILDMESGVPKEYMDLLTEVEKEQCESH